MVRALRGFQVFAKPIGAVCNLGCRYCYYVRKEHPLQEGKPICMPDDILEEYIVQHINACPDPVIAFSWHGGEPTLLGLEYFQKIAALQRKHRPSGARIVNGIQTNGTLIDADWCRFLAAERFAVGLSLDGPEELHDAYRVTKAGSRTFEKVMRGYSLLRQHEIACDILCVVHALNVQYPTQVYRFFKEIGARYMGFLPLVEHEPGFDGGVSDRTVQAEALGTFLCTIFDEWLSEDIGRIKVQIFEEAAATALGQEHSLCIFRKSCGDLPVIEHNGDFFSCDHFVDALHRLGNIRETPLVELLESPAQRAFGEMKRERLPLYCLACDVRDMCNGGCPKDRFVLTSGGEAGLNYLCEAYKRFFNHCRPFLLELSALTREQDTQPRVAPLRERGVHIEGKAGRNDACPCGSGRKYKKCCLGKKRVP